MVKADITTNAEFFWIILLLQLLFGVLVTCYVPSVYKRV
ncbi:hypothetical protein NTGBS_880015 [Candidatus Nitrotoga sp. BS]|nr:hypothetical protein NTGBS_880015 [Candidatus Nitrotoga sp. BS]